jgi:hypothetical protein
MSDTNFTDEQKAIVRALRGKGRKDSDRTLWDTLPLPDSRGGSYHLIPPVRSEPQYEQPVRKFKKNEKGEMEEDTFPNPIQKRRTWG